MSGRESSGFNCRLDRPTGPVRDRTNVWGLDFATACLTDDQLRYLVTVPDERPPVEWIWSEMDRVWDDLALSNCLPLAQQNAGAFYSHPIWLVNGIFTATDPDSQAHRSAIASFVLGRHPKRVADYGGGFGQLSRVIAESDANAEVGIVEPFPCGLAKALTDSVPNVRFVQALDGLYDVVVAQDVLEHVDDPVGLAIQLSAATSVGGVVVFANCFHPVIQCHLPSTFFLRHTFRFVMQGLGLLYLGRIPGAPHAEAYSRREEMNIARCRRREALARLAGEPLNRLGSSLRRARGVVAAGSA